jgi:hypothetical protein
MDNSNHSLQPQVNVSDRERHQPVFLKTPPRKLSDSPIGDQSATPSFTEPVTPRTRTGLSSLASSIRHSSLISGNTAWTTPPTSPASPLDHRPQQKEKHAGTRLESKIENDDEPQQKQEIKLKPLPLGVRLDSPADVSEILRRGKRELFPPPCLQCTLKGLPCDEGFPCCSRCVRVDEGEMCLNQRPVWSSEVEQDDAGLWITRFALVRFQEDDETWERKQILEREVCHFGYLNQLKTS